MRLLSCQSAGMDSRANTPVDDAATHTTVASLSEELKAALPLERIDSLSVHDRSGDPIWMSGDLVGPDEHAVAIEAITVFEVEGSCAFISERLTDELSGALFSIATARGELLGVVLLVSSSEIIESLGQSKLVTAKVRSILQRLAIVMSPAGNTTARRSTGATSRFAKLRFNPFAAAADTSNTATGLKALAGAVVPRNSVTAVATDTKPEPAPAPVREISLHVQQLMKLRSGGRTRRYEVLVRAKHSAAGAAMDETLVKALSLRESAAAIDRLVVQELAKWLKENPGVWNSDPASFSVNLSLGSLLDPEFSRFVSQCLHSSGVAPDTIGFEIQESAALKHRDAVARFILECEKVGCYIVIDDFTMHSDVVPFLASRAVRVIKVDSNLTASAMHDRLSQAIVIAISQASKVLGLHCVAKRIESTAARQWLAAVGIDFAQGYVLEDPRPITTLASPAGKEPRPTSPRPAARP